MPPGIPKDVLIADSQRFFRAGLRRMLEAEGLRVVGEAASCAETIELGEDLKPDLFVIDAELYSASEGLRRVSASSPSANIVVLSSRAEGSQLIEALTAGASGYLLKSSEPDELVKGIQHATKGQIVISSEAMRALAANTTPSNSLSGSGEQPALTARELDVLRLIVEGADNPAIGLKLSISRHTVKQHVSNIFEKLHVCNRVEAAVYAVRQNLL